MRTALVLDDVKLATRLLERLGPRYPLDEHAQRAAHAQLAEHTDDREEAARLYADAAERWRGFGNLPERAYALLGQGRCLVAVGQGGAEVALTGARDLFESMRYKLALDEAAELLKEAIAATS